MTGIRLAMVLMVAAIGCARTDPAVRSASEPASGLVARQPTEHSETDYRVPPPGSLPAGTPVVAIVIDDFGESIEQILPFQTVKVPLTYSVLPYLKEAAETVQFLKARGRDVMIHMPMEPLDPKWVENDWFLKCSMDRTQIEDRLSRALETIPGASGINNHMGSKFCLDESGMAAVMAFASRNGLFFLDSRTTAASTAKGSAEKAGVRFLERDVFLDNDDDVEKIMVQLDLLMSVAATKGCAVGIGHARPATAAAIRRHFRDRASGVVPVPAARFFDYCPRPESSAPNQVQSLPE